MPLTDLYNKIVAVQEFDVVAETLQIINANGFYIADLLKQQLAEGKDSEGKPVFAKYGPFYADATVFNKERHGVGLGRNVEWVTNYMSGVFYNSLRVVTEGESFLITSDVDYFPEILARSGNVIMELDQKHLEQFSSEILIPQLQERFSRHFNGL